MCFSEALSPVRNGVRLDPECPHFNQQRRRIYLTVKQNEFVAEITEGASQTSAYRSAYNTQNISQKTIWEETSRLRRQSRVA